ncbi:hypothetical protein [Bradyrhizobium sp. WD16]|uniref:hypothetical protein n=1 Tax=Bradyrhizobium sp. WD16 TaxID=1521768 RepID=UPI0020A263A9|nr:hypothetical protein [Bradyrhizobium sp. WD16]
MADLATRLERHQRKRATGRSTVEHTEIAKHDAGPAPGATSDSARSGIGDQLIN